MILMMLLVKNDDFIPRLVSEYSLDAVNLLDYLFHKNLKWNLTHSTSSHRLFVVALTVVAVLLIPVMASSNGGEIFRYSTTITGYLSAPTCAMFFLAMFWKRVSEPVFSLQNMTCYFVVWYWLYLWWNFIFQTFLQLLLKFKIYHHKCS